MSHHNLEHDDQRVEELIHHWHDIRVDGEEVSVEVLCAECPELMNLARQRIEQERRKSAQLAPLVQGVDSAPSEHWLPGMLLLNRFRLVEKLDKGGAGTVWKAVDTTDYDRALALKHIRLTDGLFGGLQESERRVIEVAKTLDHPNVLRIFDSWDDGADLIIAMELADMSLHRVLLDSPSRSMEFEQAYFYLLQAAKGIDYLHSHNVQKQALLHRDVKPKNLLLLDGVVKLADFGLLKAIDDTHVSHTGMMTRAYAAPEFFVGRAHKASDQYSLACTYFELRTGCHLFANDLNMANPRSIEKAHRFLPPEIPPDKFSRREIAALERALAKKHEDRWKDCEQFVAAMVPETHIQVPPARHTAKSLARVVMHAAPILARSLQDDQFVRKLTKSVLGTEASLHELPSLTRVEKWRQLLEYVNEHDLLVEFLSQGLAHLHATDASELSQAIRQHAPLSRFQEPQADYSLLDQKALNSWISNHLLPMPFSRETSVDVSQRAAKVKIVELWALSRVWGDNAQPLCSQIQSLLDVHLWPRLESCSDSQQVLRDARDAGWISTENEFTDAGVAVALAANYLLRCFRETANADQRFIFWAADHIHRLSSPREQLLATVLKWWPEAIEILRQWITEVLAESGDDAPLRERLKTLTKLVRCDRLLRVINLPNNVELGDPPSVVWARRARLPQFIANALESIGEDDPNVYARHFNNAPNDSVRRSLVGSIRRLCQNGQSMQLDDKYMELAIRCDLSDVDKDQLEELKGSAKALRRWLDLPNSDLTREQVAVLVDVFRQRDDRQQRDLAERARWKLSLPFDLRLAWESLGDLQTTWVDELKRHEVKRLNVARLAQHLRRHPPVSPAASKLIERATQS